MFSVVICSRNDNHGGHQIERFQTFIDGLEAYRERYNWDMELVIIEWNPIPSRLTLDHALKMPRKMRWRLYRVPDVVHGSFHNGNKVPMFFHLGFNAGIRRAQGEWILSCSQDLIFSDKLARFLAHGNLSPRAFYRATRVDTSIITVEGRGVNAWIDDLRQNIKRVCAYEPSRLLHTRASGDFILMHGASWRAMKGYPEYAVWGVYLDGIVLASAYAMGLEQIVLDESRVVYHIDHAGQGMDILGRYPAMSLGIYTRLTKDMIRRREMIRVNEDNWGLSDCKENKIASNVWELTGGAIGPRGIKVPRK